MDKVIMDTVIIEDLRLDTFIGVHAWEQSVKQTLLVTVELDCDARKAAANDRLADAIDYTGIASCLIAFASAHHFQLLETLAERLAQLLLAEFSADRVKITLRKPAAIAQAACAAIQLERGKKK